MTVMTPKYQFKNTVQQRIVDVLGDWQPHTTAEMMEKTQASSRNALKVLCCLLRKKIRKYNLDILVDRVDGTWRLVSLIPPYPVDQNQV